MAEGDVPEPTREQLTDPKDIAKSDFFRAVEEKAYEESMRSKEKPRYPTLNQAVEAATGRKYDQDLEALPIKPLPGAVGLKFIPQRFMPKGAGDTSEVLGDQLKKTAATPPADILKSSQWRRDLLKPNESTPKPQGGTSSSRNTSSV